MEETIATMDFEYSKLWRAMTQEGSETEDVVVHVLDADYVAMKHQRGRAVPFLTRNMVARKILDPRLSGFPLYAHGMYAVFESTANLQDRARALRRKSMYVLFPKVHAHGMPDGDAPFISGDHFSFVVSPRADESERLHLHLTEYVPWGPNQQGDTRHRKNNLPLRFVLDEDVESFGGRRLRGDLRPETLSNPLYALLRAGTSERQQTGGKPKNKGHLKARAFREARGRRVPSFEDLWYELPLHAIAFFAVKHGDGYDVTVVIRDRLSHENEHVLRRACAFRCGAADLGTVTRRATEIMASWAWSDFQDPKD